MSQNALKTSLAIVALAATALLGMAMLIAVAAPPTAAEMPSREQIKLAFLAAVAAQPTTATPWQEQIIAAPAAVKETKVAPEQVALGCREASDKDAKGRRKVKRRHHRRAQK